MRVTAGDLVVVKGQHAGQPDVHVEVLETRGANGTPPWLVRWGEDGHEGVLYPGPGATIGYTEGLPTGARGAAVLTLSRLL